jgi:hypothetical protein
MSRSNHPIEHEELMAYLDGELATDRAVAAAAHLERCQECQELAAELRKISQEMMRWEVEEPASLEISTDIAAALEKRKREPLKAPLRKTWGILLTPRRLAWGSGIVAAIVLFSFLGTSRLRPAYQDIDLTTPAREERLEGSAGKDINGTPQEMLRQSKGIGALTKKAETDDEISDGEAKPGVPTLPMIARTAGLTLTTNEFEKTRASLDEILKRYRGYLGDLKVNSPADDGRSLTATLRIPAPQLDSAMAELKKLGRVENESQGGEEVTQQYVDLEARLKNSQHTEQRLVQMLAQRTGKLQDVLKVELEIDRVRGEIEQMQAEKKELSTRVAFATLNTTINEEYHAKLQAAPPSTGSRFRNAAVEGYNTVIEGLIDVGLFLFSAGPSLLVWAAILFFPVRWAWKKIREKAKQADTSSVE